MTEGGDVRLVPEPETLTRRRNSKVKSNEVEAEKSEPFVPRIKWPDLIVQLFIHLGALYGLYLVLVSAKIYTTIFGK